MKKSIQNIDIIAYKLGLTLIRITNHKLEVIREEKQKREKIMKKWKTKAMIAKHCRVRERISSFNKQERNYGSKTKNIMDPD